MIRNAKYVEEFVLLAKKEKALRGMAYRLIEIGRCNDAMYPCVLRCRSTVLFTEENINLLNAELNPICHILALLGAHHILHVSGIRVNC